jgi:hypothetical protein
MKVKKLIKKMNQACIDGDKELERKLWQLALLKSLKRKHTHAIK